MPISHYSKEIIVKEENYESGPQATRKDIHLTRRLFHMGGGLSIGLIYQLTLNASTGDLYFRYGRFYFICS